MTVQDHYINLRHCLSQVLFQYILEGPLYNNYKQHKDLFHISTKLNIIFSIHVHVDHVY